MTKSDLSVVTPPAAPESPQNFLARLDAQQNQVIADLDALNEQIESLLRQCSDERSSDAARAA